MEQILNTVSSNIETIDAAFLEYVEGLNIFCNTINGWDKVPVIWSSAERAYQIKNNREIRDKNGSLVPPIISIERVSVVKDPKNKGIFQANLSPKNDRFVYSKILNQEKTSNFANVDTVKNDGYINFVTSKKNKKQVFKTISIPIPIYITVEYKIHILTNYQSQMNEAMQPFMSRVSQNYFLIKKDNFSYESFMEQNFDQESIISLNEEERKYKSTITVKVLGYLIGEGDNQEKPQIIEEENPVEIKFPKESLLFSEEKIEKQVSIPAKTNIAKSISSNILVKKSFLIGNGIDQVYTVNHGFLTRDVFVFVRENFGPNYSLVNVAIDYTNLGIVEIDMGDIISADSYSVTILG